MPDSPLTEVETTLAAEQRTKLIKSLGRFDAVFFIVATIVGLDLIGQAASNGPEAFFWAVALCLVFLAPYGMVMAETGAAFPVEGGPYEWVKLTMGRFVASLNTIFYWVTNPLWVGGSLAFIGTEAWSSGISHIGSGGFWDYAFKFLFIWLTITSAIVSLKIGKWVPTLGAMCKVGLVAIFAVTVIVYGIENGVEGFAIGDVSPTRAGLLAIVPLILFSFVGFEGERRGGGDEGPAEGRPAAIVRSGAPGRASATSSRSSSCCSCCRRTRSPASAVPRRGQGELHDLRRGVLVPVRRDRPAVHLHAHQLGLGLDDVRRPRPGRRVGGRRLLPLLRGLQREGRHADPRQHPLRRDGDRVHGGRGAPAQQRRGGHLRRRAEHRDLDHADLLHRPVPGGLPARRRYPGVSRPFRSRHGRPAAADRASS